MRFWYTVNFRVWWPDWPQTLLTMLTQEIFDQLIIFVNLYQSICKKSVLLILQTVYFRVQSLDWPHPFLTIPTHSPIPKIFHHLLICENCASMQNVSWFHLFILEIQPILESRDNIGHTHFWACPTKKNWLTFNFCELASTCKELGYLIDLF